MKKIFFDIFGIHSSSRHEKRCQMSVRLFPYFKALETNSEETNLTKTGKLTNVLSKSVDKKKYRKFRQNVQQKY